MTITAMGNTVVMGISTVAVEATDTPAAKGIDEPPLLAIPLRQSQEGSGGTRDAAALGYSGNPGAKARTMPGIAGPSTTMKTGGKIRKAIGTSILIGAV